MNSHTNIYINEKPINNTNQKVYYSRKEELINAKKKVESIFEFTNIVYDKKVIINTKEEILEKNIIGKENDCLVTNMHEIIPIDSIINIKEI